MHSCRRESTKLHWLSEVDKGINKSKKPLLNLHRPQHSLRTALSPLCIYKKPRKIQILFASRKLKPAVQTSSQIGFIFNGASNSIRILQHQQQHPACAGPPLERDCRAAWPIRNTDWRRRCAPYSVGRRPELRHMVSCFLLGCPHEAP